MNLQKKILKLYLKKNLQNLNLNDLIFAFNVCRYVKSNAIVLASNKTTIGIGSGQPSRLDSCQIAIDKMKKFKIHSQILLLLLMLFFHLLMELKN